MTATAGAVLCGGSSRRMGIDKALIEIDGTPMAERVARVLEAAGCEPVVFVGGDPRLAELGRRHVPDRWPGQGPVEAVLGTDAERAELRVADSGHVEPMLACWPTRLRREIEKCFAQGTRALHEVLSACMGVHVSVDMTALRNVNRPDQL